MTLRHYLRSQYSALPERPRLMSGMAVRLFDATDHSHEAPGLEAARDREKIALEHRYAVIGVVSLAVPLSLRWSARGVP